MKRVKYKTEKYNNSQSTKNVKRCKEVKRCKAVKNTKIKTLRRQLLVQPAKKTKQSKNAKCQKRQKE